MLGRVKLTVFRKHGEKVTCSFEVNMDVKDFIKRALASDIQLIDWETHLQQARDDRVVLHSLFVLEDSIDGVVHERLPFV